MFLPGLLSIPSIGNIIKRESREIKYPTVTFNIDSNSDCFLVCILFNTFISSKDFYNFFHKEDPQISFYILLRFYPVYNHQV